MTSGDEHMNTQLAVRLLGSLANHWASFIKAEDNPIAMLLYWVDSINSYG
jgi:hypothetical protein